MQPVGLSNTPASSLLNETAELRHQTTPRQLGGIRIVGEIVDISYEPNDVVFFGVGRGVMIGDILFPGSSADIMRELLMAHSGVRGILQQQENAPSSLQTRISECTFSVSQEKLQCPEEEMRCPVTLETPEKGVFVKNYGRFFGLYLI